MARFEVVTREGDVEVFCSGFHSLLSGELECVWSIGGSPETVFMKGLLSVSSDVARIERQPGGDLAVILLLTGKNIGSAGEFGQAVFDSVRALRRPSDDVCADAYNAQFSAVA